MYVFDSEHNIVFFFRLAKIQPKSWKLFQRKNSRG